MRLLYNKARQHLKQRDTPSRRVGICEGGGACWGYRLSMSFHEATDDSFRAPCPVPVVTLNKTGTCWADSTIFALFYSPPVRQVVVEILEMLGKDGSELPNGPTAEHGEKLLRYTKGLKDIYETGANAASCPPIPAGEQLLELLRPYWVMTLELDDPDDQETIKELERKNPTTILGLLAYVDDSMTGILDRKTQIYAVDAEDLAEDGTLLVGTRNGYSAHYPKLLFLSNTDPPGRRRCIGTTEMHDTIKVKVDARSKSSVKYELRSAVLVVRIGPGRSHAVALASCDPVNVELQDTRWMFFDAQSLRFHAHGTYNGFARSFIANRAGTRVWELTYMGKSLNAQEVDNVHLIYVRRDAVPLSPAKRTLANPRVLAGS